MYRPTSYPAGSSVEDIARWINDELWRLSAFLQGDIGPNSVRAQYFDLLTGPVTAKTQRLWWNNIEQCLNIGMPKDVVAQIPFEQFIRVENASGSTIADGTAVGFSGLNSEPQIAPFLADGSMPDLYFMGVLTQPLDDGEFGNVTTFGKVRGINTSMWNTGDILYCHPTVAGGLTSTRPTTPNAVIVVAAVTKVGTTDGEILVRPTIPIDMDYGSFSDTTVQTISAINTPTAVKMNTTDVAHGISISNDGNGNPTKLNITSSGLYSISVSNQYTSASASQKDVQTWLRQNGTDVPNSNSYLTLALNGGTQIFSTTYILPLSAGDYLQVFWAASDTNVTINDIPATAYSPAAPSVIISISQIQL